MRRNGITALGLLLASTVAISPALAVDLAVSSIEVTQGFQNGSTGLTAERATMIRVKVAVTGSGAGVPGVDAVLRMVVDGVDWPAGPYFSANGPITAPLAPNSASLNHTLNFVVVPPQSSNVVFRVLVNPVGSVAESSTANNLFTSAAYDFKCRAIVDLAYVPINYTYGGMGLPPAAMTKPGSADNFLRGIYAVGEWNYHRSPMGNLTFSSNVNSNASGLLVALLDLQNSIIPDAGYAKPEFIYGFLPGNPYSGNGLANSTPGSVAFGNTEEVRWQRTFAHELGHLWGRNHNGETIGVPSIDVEHHLKDPLALGPLHASTKNDVMVAGLITSQAWVSSGTYLDAWTDQRSQCTAFAPEGEGDSPQSDAANAGRAMAPANERACLRIAGVFTHEGRGLALVPVTRFDRASPTIDDPAGDLSIETLDAAGGLLHRVRVRTDTMLESCAGGGERLPTACVYALVPAPEPAARVARVVVRDLRAAARPAGAAPAGVAGGAGAER
ncbi:MAG: hypothetical protein FJ253_07800, partial [Phycisphaerae bacterium]|nr:hypothetical protein [Phycisphaerae bacterium]